MIYICADDYGLCDTASFHIRQCMEHGPLNKISVFPNFDKVDLNEILNNKNACASLHLNLVEGRCMAFADEMDLLTDDKGIFKHTFLGILKLNIFQKQKLEAQAYKEIKAQVLYWKSILPDGAPFMVDSHQHTHMIPAVFKALIKVLAEERISAEYIRIPAEPILPYLKTPSLYFTYSLVNIIKQWLLKFLWFVNKRNIKQFHIPTAYFFGVLFSGKMDKKRVDKILPLYRKMAEKNNIDVEVLFHPGYVQDNELDIKKLPFEKFYYSKNRKTEFDTLMKEV